MPRDDLGHARRGRAVQAQRRILPKAVGTSNRPSATLPATHLRTCQPIFPPSRPLALRVGRPKTVRGAFPVPRSRRGRRPRQPCGGFREDRFAGESRPSTGNGELRVRLTRLRFPSPGELGAFRCRGCGDGLFYDVDSEEADGLAHWQRRRGFGISFLKRRAMLSAAMMEGEDLTGIYLRVRIHVLETRFGLSGHAKSRYGMCIWNTGTSCPVLTMRNDLGCPTPSWIAKSSTANPGDGVGEDRPVSPRSRATPLPAETRPAHDVQPSDFVRLEDL